MNKNTITRRKRSGAHNLFVGIGATAFFVLLIVHGVRTGNADTADKGQDQTKEITITKTNFEAEVLKSDKPVSGTPRDIMSHAIRGRAHTPGAPQSR